MSDYTVTTDFSVKDGLTSGDPEKIILGSDIDVEFDAIAVAIATKPNEVASPVANNLIKQDANGNNIDADSISDNGSVVAIATGRTLNVVDAGGFYLAGVSVTSTAAELNKLDGCTSSTAELNLLTGVTTLWHAGNDGAGSTLDADLLDGQHGSYYTNATNLSSGTVPVARLPAASDTAKGAIEIATAAECNALTSTTLAVTPGRIPTASTTQKGISELATDAEIKTGSDTGRTVTPSGLRANGMPQLLATASPSAASTVDFGTIFEDYTDFNYFKIRGFLSVSTTAQLRMRVSLDSGVTFTTAGIYYSAVSGYTSAAVEDYAAANTTYLILSSASISAAAGQGIAFELMIPYPQTTTAKNITGTATWMNGALKAVVASVGGVFNTGTAIDGFRLLLDTGTMTGEVEVYGYV